MFYQSTFLFPLSFCFLPFVFPVVEYFAFEHKKLQLSTPFWLPLSETCTVQFLIQSFCTKRFMREPFESSKQRKILSVTEVKLFFSFSFTNIVVEGTLIKQTTQSRAQFNRKLAYFSHPTSQFLEKEGAGEYSLIMFHKKISRYRYFTFRFTENMLNGELFTWIIQIGNSNLKIFF